MNLIRVIELERLGGFKLKLVFNDGLSGVLDLSHLLTGAIFSPLKESEYFASAQVRYGTVVWANNVDMAPEYLHDQMIKQGVKLNHLSSAS